MKTSIVQLEPHDDALSIRDKISWSKTNRVLLVWPVRGLQLQKIDLVMIQRACQKNGAQVALVTPDEDIRYIAAELGIPVFTTLHQAQTSFWRRPRVKKRKIERSQWAGAPARPERPKLTSFTEHKLVRIGLFAAGVMAVLVLAGFFLPEAEIRLHPARETQTLVLEVRPNLTLSSPNVSGGVPAVLRTIVVEGQDQIPSSGLTQVPVRAAEGVVMFTNLTGEPVSIPAGLIVTSAGQPAIRFTVIQAVELGGKLNQTAQGRVRAVAPGTAGNVAAGSLRAVEGALGSRVAVSNPSPTTGGQDEQGSAPTPEDRETLQRRLVTQLEQTALAELKSTIGKDYLLDATLRMKGVVEEMYEPPDARQSDYLRLSMRVEFEAWVVRGGDLERLANIAMDAGLLPQQRGLADTLVIEPSPDEELRDGVILWSVRVSRMTEGTLPREQVLGLVSGRTPADARRQLSAAFNLRQDPEIWLFPEWWPNLPVLVFRITVEAE